ncbi:TIR domain-containing protein [Candidatus Lokiarchaeum ossiferum]|uniref:TIR domain-containing protein n=1 Tax=Candidatus Lokiarchaeum ossiferum TaxID=2951803 RepID=UPI00352D26A3
MQDQEKIISRLRTLMNEIQRSKIEQFTELIEKANNLVLEIFGEQYKPFSITNRQKFTHEDSPSAKYMKEMYWLQTNRPNLIDFLRNFISELESKQRIYIMHEEASEMQELVEKAVKQLRFIPKYFYDNETPRKSVIDRLKSKNDIGFIIFVISPNLNSGSTLGKNLFFDLGYLAGKLTLEKVMVLYHDTESFDIPSDLQQSLYCPFDDNWEAKLKEKLKLCGYSILE